MRLHASHLYLAAALLAVGCGLARAQTPEPPDPVQRALTIDEAANPLQYGAKGDGVADDTRALQLALSTRHKRIFVPPGVYRISAALKISSNKRLTLAPGATIKRMAPISVMLINDSDGTKANFQATEGVIVEGGIWDGNAAQFPQQCTIIAFGHASDVTVRDTRIVNAPIWHAIELNATRRGRVERVNIVGCTNEAIQLDSMNTQNPGVFPWFGPYNGAICQDILIQDCSFESVATAVGSHSAPPVDNVTIRRCRVEGSTEPAIKPKGYLNLRVEDCEFIRCHNAIAGSASQFAFKGNYIYESIGADIDLSGCKNGVVERTVLVASIRGIVNKDSTVQVSATEVRARHTPAGPQLTDAPAQDSFWVATAPGNDPSFQRQISPPASGATYKAFTEENILIRVHASGTPPFTYAWRKDGLAIAQANSPFLPIPRARRSDAGKYDVTISNPSGASVVQELTLDIADEANPSVLTNFSVRAELQDVKQDIAVGFSVTGSQGNTLLVRAIGETLETFGIPGPMLDPALFLYDATGRLLATNDNWSDELKPVFLATGAFPLPEDSKDSALLAVLPAGSYTARASAKRGGTGLIEVYAPQENTGATNLSALSQLEVNGASLTGGFTVGGRERHRILVRAAGEALNGLGIQTQVANLRVDIFSAAGVLVASTEKRDPGLNSLFSQIGAFRFPDNSSDVALLVELRSGTYSVVVKTTQGEGGAALLEIYSVN